jgi:hypothetical protein
MLKKIVAVGALLLVIVLTMPWWKPAAKRFKWVVIAANVYHETLRRAHLRSDQVSQPDYSGLPLSDIPVYLGRIDTTFAAYQKYAALTPDVLRDARVLEVGPGETLGVALQFIAAGARSVTAVDKFMPLQTSSFHRALYETLMS